MSNRVTDDQAAAPAASLVAVAVLEGSEPPPESAANVAIVGRRVRRPGSGLTVSRRGYREDEGGCYEVRHLQTGMVIAVREERHLAHERIRIASGAPLLSEHRVRDWRSGARLRMPTSCG